jgi:cytoskeletal protein CcmA (bactofilin family)
MFSKKHDEFRESQPVARAPASGSTFSVIGSDVVIKGDVTATVDLHVDGRIEGDIQCASLVQGEGSHIEGAITAETARLAGSVSGSITARELVVLRTARIQGDVHYDALTIEQGAEVEGRFAHRVPSKASAAKAEDGAPTLTLAG